MSFLFLNQFFYPDTAATSQLVTDLARHVAAQHTVTAICGSGEYVAGPGSARGVAADQLPGLRIVRTQTPAFARRAAARITGYAAYLVGALYHGLREARPETTIVTLTTPPLLAVVGAILKKGRSGSLVIWEMDVYPDIATDLGVLRIGGPVARIVRALSNWAHREAKAIVVLGPEMKERLRARGVPAEKIHICENWADGNDIVPLPFPAGPLTIHYSGNLGLPHDVATIRQAMLLRARDSRFGFVFAGSGARKDELAEFALAHGLENVVFKPYCARDELRSSLAEGHIGLITQKPETLGSIVPSKTYGIMAAGRPLLYIGPREATPARIIAEYDCGWQIDPGDVVGLLELLEFIERRRDLVEAAGARARAAFENHYDRSIGVGRIARVLGIQPEPPTRESAPGTEGAPRVSFCLGDTV